MRLTRRWRLNRKDILTFVVVAGSAGIYWLLRPFSSLVMSLGLSVALTLLLGSLDYFRKNVR